MPDYLITLSIGPVQDFITAARRTRDLWSGSFLLSEISKAAAKSFHIQGAELIFRNFSITPCKDLKRAGLATPDALYSGHGTAPISAGSNAIRR